MDTAVALEFIRSHHHGVMATRRADGLPAMSPIACDVDADGIHRRPVMPLTGHMLGLVQSVKAVEQLTIRAALEHTFS